MKKDQNKICTKTHFSTTSRLNCQICRNYDDKEQREKKDKEREFKKMSKKEKLDKIIRVDMDILRDSNSQTIYDIFYEGILPYKKLLLKDIVKINQQYFIEYYFI